MKNINLKQEEIGALQQTQPIILTYNDHPITLSNKHGKPMINATQMAVSFGKRPLEWLYLAETKRLREFLVQKGVSASYEEQIITTRGRNNNATWMEPELAMAFARWLSPEFSAWCDERITELMNQGYMMLEPGLEDTFAQFLDENPQSRKRRRRSKQREKTEIVKSPRTPAPRQRMGDVMAQYAVPTSFAEALKLAAMQQEQIMRDRPKVEYYEANVENRTWFRSSRIADELNISVPQLNTFLVSHGIVTKDKTRYVAQMQYRALQCAVPVMWTNPKTGKTFRTGDIYRWTPEGREYILDLWHSENPRLLISQKKRQ